MPETTTYSFKPIKRQGLFLLGFSVFISLAASIALFILSMQEQYGAFFVLFLVISLILMIPGFFMLYRFYALIRAEYKVSREGVLLQWGLRREEIPLNDIDWVRQESKLEIDLRPPPFSLPGAVLGTVPHEELGEVEFMASDIHSLILISTPKKMFAISPANAASFLDCFRRSFELGSLMPLQSTSVLPATYLRTVWLDKRARALILTGFILALLLLTVVSLAIPTLAPVSIGFDAFGKELPPVTSTRLLLLPILCIFFFFVNLISGLYYFRKVENRPIAFTLWIGSIITGLLLSTAVAIILL
jgi:hypothetical protein